MTKMHGVNSVKFFHCCFIIFVFLRIPVVSVAVLKNVHVIRFKKNKKVEEMCFLLLFLTRDGVTSLSGSIALELVRQAFLARTDEHLVSARKMLPLHSGTTGSSHW